MAPLSSEIRPIVSCDPPHIGPAIPEVINLIFLFTGIFVISYNNETIMHQLKKLYFIAFPLYIASLFKTFCKFLFR